MDSPSLPGVVLLALIIDSETSFFSEWGESSDAPTTDGVEKGISSLRGCLLRRFLTSAFLFSVILGVGGSSRRNRSSKGGVENSLLDMFYLEVSKTSFESLTISGFFWKKGVLAFTTTFRNTFFSIYDGI